MRFVLGLLSLLAYCAVFLQDAAADWLYSNCIMSYEIGGDISNIHPYLVSPINKDCYASCGIGCNQFSSKVGDRELNPDVVLACQTACQGGQQFTSTYKQYAFVNGAITYVTVGPTTMASTCTSGALMPESAVVKTINVSQGAPVQITYTGGDEDSVILCGQKYVRMPPIFSSTTMTDWNSTNQQTQWTAPSQHPCLNTLNTADFITLNNQMLWSPNQSITKVPANQQGTNGICKWSARNPNYTDTGLYVADGDQLTIFWSGDYGNNQTTVIEVPNGNSNQTSQVTVGTNMKRLEIAKCMRNMLLPNYPGNLPDSQKTQSAAFCSTLWRNTSILDIMPPGQSNMNYDSHAEPIQLIGEDARVGVLGLQLPPPDPNVNIMGLRGAALDLNLVTKQPPGCDPTNPPNDPLCFEIDNFDNMQYFFFGQVDGFSDARIPFAIRHGDSPYGTENAPASAWARHLGGFDVTMLWQGCLFKNGERAQYAISNSFPQESDWQDLPKAVMQGGTMSAGATGDIYLRIHRLSPPPNLPASIKALYTDSGNLYGAYHFRVQNNSNTNAFIGFLRTLIQTVYTVLIGDANNTGVVQVIYNGVINSTGKLIMFVQALLTFYITIMGLGFMLGTIKTTQQEIIVRAVKAAFVIAAISPGSWEFFGVFCVNLLVKGGAEIIAYVMPGTLPAAYLNPDGSLPDPSVIFELFDQPISQIFSPNMGRKMAALINAGFFGFLAVLIIGFSFILYTLSIAKAALMYIYTLIGFSMLLIMLPVILPFMLFQITRSIFESWWKYMVSYALQPIMIFAVMGVINMVYIALLHMSLNFTACRFCWFAFIWDQKTIDEFLHKKNCSIYSWTPLITAHAPFADNGMSLPLGAFFCGLAVLLVSHIMFRLPGAVAELATRIVTGAPIRLMTAAQPVDQMSKAGTYARKRLKATAKDTGKAMYRSAKRREYKKIRDARKDGAKDTGGDSDD
ncbi:MAG: type IV secretion system protein [Proteobacteria bacterium]|nr:type IV secretion system protein [Pseudomonadota bacterium]